MKAAPISRFSLSRSWGRFPALLLVLLVGCRTVRVVDTTPLDSVGMSYDSIQKTKSLQISTSEVAALAKVRKAGLSDNGCIILLQLYRDRSQTFDSGDVVAGLMRVHMSEDALIQLARLNQLGVGAGELQAMRLAGISDGTVLEVARDRAAGKPVFSGASLANMKNAGIGESTLQELVRRSIPDSQLDSILSLRRRSRSDAEILKHFPGS